MYTLARSFELTTALVRCLMYNARNQLDRPSTHPSFHVIIYGIPAAWTLVDDRMSYVLVLVANGQQLLTLRLTENLNYVIKLGYVIKHCGCDDRDLYPHRSSHRDLLIGHAHYPERRCLFIHKTCHGSRCPV